MTAGSVGHGATGPRPTGSSSTSVSPLSSPARPRYRLTTSARLARLERVFAIISTHRGRPTSDLGRRAARFWDFLAPPLTVALVAWAVLIWALRWQAFERAGAIGLDERVFRAWGERWLATGSLYAPWQLTGPYAWAHLPRPPAEVAFDGSVIPCLYPPIVAYLAVPLVVLPPVVWWLVPLGTIAAVLWRARPPRWTWPILALVAGHPDTAATVWAGSSTMWAAAAAIAGVRYGWPAALILAKPTFAPLALLGARRRSWWRALALLALASLPLGGEWLRWLAAVGNAAEGPPLGAAVVAMVAIGGVAVLGGRRWKLP